MIVQSHALNTDVMMILCCVWLIRCDALHICSESRLAANLSFFLPYVVGCKLLSSSNVDQHMTGHMREDEDDDDFDRYSVLIHGMISDKDEAEDLSGKELRGKNDSVYRLRKENARIFKTLALY
eukprot:928184_1